MEEQIRENYMNMDGGDSPHSSIPVDSLSGCEEKYVFFDLHQYEHLKLGRL